MGSCRQPRHLRRSFPRKMHGGAPFDINLPLTGNPGIECRIGGATNNYQVVFTFASPVTFNNAAVTAGAGSVTSSSGSGTTTITVDLIGVTNAQNVSDDNIARRKRRPKRGNTPQRRDCSDGCSRWRHQWRSFCQRRRHHANAQPLRSNHHRDELPLGRERGWFRQQRRHNGRARARSGTSLSSP